MEKLVILSACEKIRSHWEGGFETVFAFKGQYKGQLIKSVVLFSDRPFEAGVEYLIWAQFREVNAHTLYGTAIKWRSLDDLRTSPC